MSKFDKFLLDRQYVQIVGPRLERFGKTTNSCHMARCPACGDSKKSKTKRRLCFVEKDNTVFVYCQNCGRSWSMQMFIEEFFKDTYDEYFKELMRILYGEKKQDTIKVSKSRIQIRDLYKSSSSLENNESHDGISLMEFVGFMNPISMSDENSDEVKYLKSRKFTNDQMQYLFVTDDFKSIASMLDKHGDHSKLLDNEKRIIIPFINFKTGNVYAIQGRSLDPNNKMRYITIKFSESTEKVYCKEPLNIDDEIICVEGPFDSLFIKNSIAACDSNLTRAKADIYVWDNEPYNRTTISKIEKAIKSGHRVCIWDFSPVGKVDINDLVKDYDFSPDEIRNKILSCTYSGLEAQYMLSKWKRV